MDDKSPGPLIGRIAAGIDALRDRAASLRSRLLDERETFIRLREELAALRQIADRLPPEEPPAAAEPAVPAPPVQETAPAPPEPPSPPEITASAETTALPEITAPPVLESVPAAKPEAVEPPPVPAAPPKRRSRLMIALPVVCLAAASMMILKSRGSRVARRAAPPKAEAPAPAPKKKAPVPASAAVDENSAAALALVRQWRMAGDDKSVFERLGGVTEHPGGVPAWSVEMLDEGSYLVIFREAAGTPIYAFEVALKAKTVLPTPEATERLTLIRVRDMATAGLQTGSAARSYSEAETTRKRAKSPTRR